VHLTITYVVLACWSCRLTRRLWNVTWSVPLQKLRILVPIIYNFQCIRYSPTACVSRLYLKTFWHVTTFDTRNPCDFYCATLCVSSVSAVARRPSVCPSRWWIVSKRLNISSFSFSARYRCHSSFFLTPSAVTKFQGEPLQQNTNGDFRQKSPSISERLRDRPVVAMKR